MVQHDRDGDAVGRVVARGQRVRKPVRRAQHGRFDRPAREVGAKQHVAPERVRLRVVRRARGFRLALSRHDGIEAPQQAGEALGREHSRVRVGRRTDEALQRV